MRALLLLPMLLLLSLAACGERQGLVPDRGQHAMRFGSSMPGGGERDWGPAQPGPVTANEVEISFTTGDRLYKIAERHDVELSWLIQRNDLSSLPRPGQVLIVPRRAGSPH